MERESVFGTQSYGLFSSVVNMCLWLDERVNPALL